MTRTAEDFMAGQAASPKAEANGDSQSPPPTSEKRSKLSPMAVPLFFCLLGTPPLCHFLFQ